ncbi:MAG: energy-coupling factor transporter transmembrane protein EcfT [Actinobacteria bacterium]|nr:energy-coupling factor transporter transmembrane protein EcfT [Actinomycetota bacterium]
MTWVEELDPRTKLAWCLCLILSALLSNVVMVEVGILILVIATDCFFSRDLKSYRILLPVILVVASQILIIQLLFCREGVPLWQWGVISVYSGATPAAALGISRTAAVTFAAVQFMTRTPAMDVALMLVSWRIPYRYAMLTIVAKRFLPLMQREYRAISESQSIRGIPTDGIKDKIKSLPLALMPLLFRAVRRTSDIALSMELKGYGRSNQRTFEKQLCLKNREKIGMLLLFSVFIAANFI